jgi:hypothetical protein
MMQYLVVNSFFRCSVYCSRVDESSLSFSIHSSPVVPKIAAVVSQKARECGNFIRSSPREHSCI